MATDDARIAYWSEPAAATCAALASSERGLAGGEAALRLERHGANSFDEEPEHAVWLLFRHQLASPLVLILIAGAAVSLVLRDWLDAAIILAIVLGSVALGFAQEYRASAAVTALRQRLALTARVLRDGALQTVPATHARPRRRRRPRRRQPRSGGRDRARGARLPGLRGESHRRVVPGRKGAGHCRRRRAARAPRQLRVRRHVGEERQRPRAGGRDWPSHGLWRDRDRARRAGPGDRVRARHTRLRLPAGAGDDRHGAVRAGRQPRAGPAGDRVAAVRDRPCRRPVAGTPARDRQRDAGARGAEDERERRHRPAARGDREPRQHRRLLRRQDRHAHHRRRRARCRGRPCGSAVGRGAAAGLPQLGAGDRDRESARRGDRRRRQRGRPRAPQATPRSTRSPTTSSAAG